MDTASIDEVAGILRENGPLGTKKRRRTVIWWGAGCSKTGNVPLSSEIVRRVKLSHPKAYERAETPDYMPVMKALTRDEREDLIRDLIEDAQMNWAHVALAYLIANGFVHVVFTTNFDPLIERACSLIGYSRLAVYDLPATSKSVFEEALIQQPALIYLNGRHNGLRQHHFPESPHNGLATEATRSCAHDCWLAIGYSGINDDLLQAISGPLFQAPRYWALHGSEPNAKIKSAIWPSDGGFLPIPNVDADQFMIELVCKLGDFPPEFFLKPANHLRTQLKSFTQEMPSGAEHVVDFTRNLLTFYERQVPGDIDRVFSEVFRLLYANPTEILSFVNNPTQSEIIRGHKALADLACQGCIKAGDKWHKQCREMIEGPIEPGGSLETVLSTNRARHHARENYETAQGLSEESLPYVKQSLSELLAENLTPALALVGSPGPGKNAVLSHVIQGLRSMWTVPKGSDLPRANRQAGPRYTGKEHILESVVLVRCPAGNDSPCYYYRLVSSDPVNDVKNHPEKWRDGDTDEIHGWIIDGHLEFALFIVDFEESCAEEMTFSSERLLRACSHYVVCHDGEPEQDGWDELCRASGLECLGRVDLVSARQTKSPSGVSDEIYAFVIDPAAAPDINTDRINKLVQEISDLRRPLDGPVDSQ